MRFGLHIGISGGFAKVPQRAKDLSCDCFQIFVSNPRSWQKPNALKSDIDEFISRRKELNLFPAVVHVTYLPNIASPDKDQNKKSLEHMLEQYRLAANLQAEYFVIHPGSHKGAGLEEGAKNIASGLNKIFKNVKKGPLLLLENTSGSGNNIGATASELAMIAKKINDKKRLGICLDTCHAFGAGEDIRGKGSFARLINSYEDEIFKDCVKLIHANDSKKELASHKDRHEHIALGEIGKEGFKNILSCRKAHDLPFILETPVNDFRDDLGNLQEIRKLFLS